MSGRLPYLNHRLQNFTTTIFAEMSALAVATDSINLGQGFPDTDGPESIKRAAMEAIAAGHNQYPPGKGIPELREAISYHQQHYYGLSFDPETEVLVTAGATEAIAAAVIGLCETGDEVVLFEPYYDSYPACVAMAGATHRVVTLHGPHWNFDPDELDRAISPQTRLILVNSPHNPTGKVFNREELGLIADRCIRHDLIAITDEVYEHLIFEADHLPLASFPGMPERTVTISSAAKTFSFTGWKVGWVCAPEALLTAVRTPKQFLTYANATPFQYAVASGLRSEGDYIAGIADTLRRKRDALASGLSEIGFDVFHSTGTFFITTDVSAIGPTDGMEFCLQLPQRCGVVAVPSSVFYDHKDIGKSLVRRTFCKQDHILELAIERLRTLKA